MSDSPAAGPSAEAAIPAYFEQIYAAFLAGDTGALDSYLDDDITIWVPSQPQLSLGIAGLDAIRARRPPDAGVNAATSVAVHDMVVSSHQDIAWARHVIVVGYADAEPEVMRCTSVWQRTTSGWLQVHSHEDLLPGVSYPFEAPAGSGAASA